MADFSDDQDAVLVCLVRPYLQSHRPIEWDIVAKRMRLKGKSKDALRERLKTLKKTHGKNLDRFPASFFRKRPVLLPTQNSTVQTSQPLALQSRSRSPRTAHRIIDLVFEGIDQRAVRQQPGKTHLNAGEIAPSGVSILLKEVDVCSSDTVGDIGCGIGNILVQVALEARVKACIGIEVRPKLVAAAHKTIHQHSSQYPELRTISIYNGDVNFINQERECALSGCSVIIANNIIFEETSNHALEQFLCVSSAARKIVLGRKMCPRHRDSCSRIFCLLWNFKGVIDLEVIWTSNLKMFYIYERIQLPAL